MYVSINDDECINSCHPVNHNLGIMHRHPCGVEEEYVSQFESPLNLSNQAIFTGHNTYNSYNSVFALLPCLIFLAGNSSEV